MTKDDREFYLSLGVCPVCRKEKLFGDEKTCIMCRAQKAEHEQSRRSNNKEYVLARERQVRKALRDKRIEQGICVKCGKAKAEKGKQKCLKCNMKWRAYSNMRYSAGM